MIAMAQTEYRSIAEEAMDELREDVGVENPQLKKMTIYTG